MSQKRSYARLSRLSQFSSFTDHQAVYRFVYPGDFPVSLYIALHRASSGAPGHGGVRTLSYENEKEAIEDALRLSYAMSQKAVMAEVPYGGAKAVLNTQHSILEKNRALIFEWVGECIERLEGLYIAGEDMGVGQDDLRNMRKQTIHVRGIPENNFAGDAGSAMTAYGVYQGIHAALDFSKRIINYPHYSVQGCLGKVGLELCKILIAEKCHLFVSDLKGEEAIHSTFTRCGFPEDRFRVIHPDAIRAQNADVFIPCAVGGILDGQVIPYLPPVVAGAANNQLTSSDVGAELHAKGILYVPDFVLNAGGLITTSYEGKGLDYARFQTGQIYGRVMRILQRAKALNIPPSLYAEEMACGKLACA
jgi:leucine dehydrogenase